MPLAHESVVYDVHDAKVYAMLSDVVGAAPTYSSAVDVPGITELSVDPNIVSAELKGDGKVIAKKGRTDRMNGSATYGKLSLNAIQTVMGGTVGDTASTQAGFRLSGPAPLPYFKLEAKIEDLDLGFGDLHIVVYKCQLTGGTLVSTSSDNFNQPSFDFEGLSIEGSIPANTNSIVAAGLAAMIDIFFNSVAQPLSA